MLTSQVSAFKTISTCSLSRVKKEISLPRTLGCRCKKQQIPRTDRESSLTRILGLININGFNSIMTGKGRRGAKARSGCFTCKQRKVKCDEAKPICKRCQTSKRHCEGYPSINRSIIPYPFQATQHEWQAYEYYVREASQNFETLNDNFWHEMVLQFAQDQASVRSAVIALGFLCRHVKECSETCHCEDYQNALKYYNKSIIRLVNAGNDHQVSLLTCALFTCIEAILGHCENALILIRRGHDIVEADPNQNETLSHLYSRMRLLSMVFGQPLSKQPQRNSTRITSLSEARYSLYSIMNDSIDFLRYATSAKWELDPKDEKLLALETRQVELQKEFEVWTSNTTCLSKEDRATEYFAILQVLQTLASIWLANVLCRAEYVSGSEFQHFTTIVDKASLFLKEKQPPFVFEMKWIAPLYFVGVKCRDPTLRRKALSLLSLTSRKEGIWDQADTIATVSRVIDLEESAGRLLFSVDRGLQFVEDGITKVTVVYAWPLGDENRWMVMSEDLIIDDPLHPVAVNPKRAEVESWSESLRLRGEWTWKTEYDTETRSESIVYRPSPGDLIEC